MCKQIRPQGWGVGHVSHCCNLKYAASTFCILFGSFVGASLGGTFPKSFHPGSLCSTGRLSFTLLANRLLRGGGTNILGPLFYGSKGGTRAIITLLTWSPVEPPRAAKMCVPMRSCGLKDESLQATDRAFPQPM